MLFRCLIELFDSLRQILFRLARPLMTDQAIELHDLGQALRRIDKGRLDEAKDILQRAIESNSVNPLFYQLRGLIYELQSKYDKAISDFGQAVTLNSRESESYSCRGRIWSKLGEYGRAVDDFNNALALKPNTEVHLARGEAYRELGEYYAALDDYDRAITLGPTADAYIARGTVYYRLQKYDAAMNDFNKATLLDRSNTQPFTMRGNIYQDQGNHEKAIDEYTQVIALIADRIEADISDLEFLLSGDMKSGLYELAILDLGNVLCGRGVCRSRTKDSEGALADLDSAIRLIPTDANFYCARGIAYIEMGEHEKAMEELDVAIKLDTKSASALFIRAEFHLDNGDCQEAITDAHRAIELNPDWSDLLWIEGKARLHLGEYGKAIENFSRAIEVASAHRSEPSQQSRGVSTTLGRPIIGAAYASRGLAYSLLGNNINARDDFIRALELKHSQAEVEKEIAELIAGEEDRRTVMDLVRAIATNGRPRVAGQSQNSASKTPSLTRRANS